MYGGGGYIEGTVVVGYIDGTVMVGYIEGTVIEELLSSAMTS